MAAQQALKPIHWCDVVASCLRDSCNDNALVYWKAQIEAGKASVFQAFDALGFVGIFVIWVDERSDGNRHLVLGPAGGEVLKMYRLAWSEVNALAHYLGCTKIRVDCDRKDYAEAVMDRYGFVHYQTQIIHDLEPLKEVPNVG